MSNKLVILGAGVGGLSVLKELRDSQVPLDGVEITMVDESFEHFLGFTLPWVMRGWRSEESVPIRPAQDALPDVAAVRAKVSGVDPARKAVALEDGSELEFDALVLALGSKNAPHKVPGLQEAMEAGAAVHYYSTEAAGAAHAALESFTGGKLVFLVASTPYRCPVAPYEGALLAADLLAERGVRGAAEISVYTPETLPMPSAGPLAGPQLVELLREQSISFHPEHSVEKVNHQAGTLQFSNGETVPFDLLVFVPPHEPAVSLGEPGWVQVDRESLETGYAGIWAVGDITSVTSPWGKPLPKAAIFAKNGGKAVARNVLRHFGKTEEGQSLSGLGYCFIDTGEHRSARGKGDFFALPHPGVVLENPSAELHQDKQAEEQEWRGFWE